MTPHIILIHIQSLFLASNTYLTVFTHARPLGNMARTSVHVTANRKKQTNMGSQVWFAVSTYVLIFWLHNQVGCALGALTPPASVPIPSQPVGIVLGNGSASAPVQIEVFLELLCPDSSATWRSLKQLYRSYDRTKVRFVIYQFPLPYHSNGFMVTQVTFSLTILYQRL